MIRSSRIRKVEESDLAMLLAWRNHPSIRSFMLTQHEIGMEEHFTWFKKASADASRQLLIIEEKGAPLGYVQLSCTVEDGIADWGFYVRPDAPKGSGRIIGEMALDHAFHTLNLHKVCGQAIASNATSIALHQKLGFTQEGVLRDQQRIEGSYHSLVCFGLLRQEWRNDFGKYGRQNDWN